VNPTPNHPRFSFHPLFQFVAIVSICGSVAFRAAADTSTDAAGSQGGAPDKIVRLQEFEVTSDRTPTAQTESLTDAPLEITQPQSSISVDTINNSIVPTADYSTIANLAPSVQNVETNGPGLSESKLITIRGLQDGQYNVTYDGIPFADSNDFTHHTTSYFPAKLIGRLDVDRGPGDASTIGYATFGGTIALYSKDPREDMVFVPTVTTGSWGTYLGNFEANTGLLPQLNNASVIASYQYEHSDGYRTFTTLDRNTYYIKYIQPVGKNTTITFLSSYNNIKFGNPSTLTQAQITQFGRNSGLSNNPQDSSNLTPGGFYGYNWQAKQADFEYIGVDTTFGNGWNLDDKAYTYYYNNISHENPDNTAGASKHDIGGFLKINEYRSWGDYLNLSHNDDLGTFKTGIWLEYITNPRSRYAIDYTQGDALGAPNGVIDPTQHPEQAAFSTGGFDYNMHDYIKTVQPYAEYSWHVTKKLSINAGVKYSSITRDVTGPINQTFDQLPINFHKTYSKALPYLTANYRIDSDWSAYAQVAEGFLAPALNLFQVDFPQSDNVKPEQSWNYQAGTVYKHGRLDADTDVYAINFSNFPVTVQDPNSSNPDDTITVESPGAYYYGWEAEMTYYLGAGLSITGNGSLNRATFKGSNLNVPQVPNSTADVGLVYQQGGFFASIFDKYDGPFNQYSNFTSPSDGGGTGIVNNFNPSLANTFGATTRSGGYWLADLSVGYDTKLPKGYFLRSVKAKFEVNDLFNRDVQVVNSVSGKGVAKFNVLPNRSYFFTLSGEF
jgi:iron complex outermembrane receptor protein